MTFSFSFIKRYYETVLLIIEDRPKFEMPVGVYKTLILVSYLQIFIYLLTSNETKKIDDVKLLSVANIIQMVSVNNILALRANDVLSLIIMILAEAFVYFYFIYVAIVTVLKEYFKQFYESQKKAFVNINQILNLYFALYMQVFFTFFVELNCSLFLCSDNSLFNSERNVTKQQTCSPQFWKSIVGIIGLVLTLLTAWTSCYFFRNYEFLESSLIKRRTSWIYGIVVILKFVLTLLYFENIDYLNEFKHILSQAIGVLSLVDFFLNKPYSDSSISSFYLRVITWYYMLVNISHFWIFTELFQHGEYFYFSLIVGMIFDSFTASANQRLLDYYMLTPIRPNYFPQKLDFFLEEMVRLAIDSSKEESAKIKLLKLFKNHLQLCENKDCPCRGIQSNNLQQNQAAKRNNQEQQSETKSTYSVQQQIKPNSEQQTEGELIKNREISQEHVFEVVDAIFKYFLKQNKVISQTAEYEHFSLKYITFLIKMLKNHTRANYELKVLSYLKKDYSSYFTMISSFISDNILEVLQDINSDAGERRKEEITVKQLVSIDFIAFKYIPIILQIMVEKQQLWLHLQNGYSNMNAFQKDAIKLMSTVQINNLKFTQEMSNLQKTEQVGTCLQFQKLNSLFYLFVLNDTIKAYEIENLIVDLRKRDSLKDQETLNNENYLKSQIATLTISLAQSIGKIVSRKDEKTANFFGFQGQDFQKVSKVNELMPPYLSRIHDKAIKQFINRGESTQIKGSLFSFIKNQNGFIEHAKIYLDISTILQDDFTMHGTLLKVNPAMDYILFDRQGQVLGLTSRFAQYLLSVSIQSGHKLPAGELISSNLHALLLFPGIAKKIFKRKEQILKNSKNQDELLIADKRCSIVLHSSILTEIKKLYSFINRSNSFQRTKSKKRYSSSNGTTNGTEQLDILKQSTYDILGDFKDQEGNSTSQGYSSERQANQKTMLMPTQHKQANNQKVIVLRFTYSLLYSTISNDLTNEPELVFQVKARDLSLGTKKEKEEVSFRKSLCTYFLSTTSIHQMQQLIKPETILTGSNNLFPQPSGDPMKELSSFNEWVFSTDDIPQNLLKLADSNLNAPLAQVSSTKIENPHQKDNEEEFRTLKSRIQTEEDEEFEKLQEDEENQRNKLTFEDMRKKKSVNDQYESSKFEELDQILQANSINQEKVLAYDPNFKIKKVIQAKTLSVKFSRALEKAILEALIELNAEQSLLPNQKILENNDLATFREAPLYSRTLTNQKPEDLLLSSIKNEGVSKVPTNTRGEYSLEKTQTTEGGIYQLQNSFYAVQTHADGAFDQFSSVKHNVEDQLKYTDISARPLVTKANEINNFEIENIVTVSADEAIKPTTQETNIEIYNASKKKQNKELTFKEQSSLPKLQSSLRFNEKVPSSLQNKETTLEYLQKQSTNPKEIEKKGVFLSTQLEANQLVNPQKQLSDAFSKNVNSDANGNQAIDDISGKMHEIAVARILTQKGLANNKDNLNNNNASVHSSTRSSSTSGGKFLRGNFVQFLYFCKYLLIFFLRLVKYLEIIKLHKLPKQSFQYSFLLITFITVFISLNFTNLFIIQSDMQYFSDNVIVLRQPRKFLRAYSRCMYGMMIEMEIKIGYITDTDSSLATLSKNYLNYCSSEYMTLLQNYGSTMTTYTQKRQSSLSTTSIDMQVYTNQKLGSQTVEQANVFMYNFNYIIGVMKNQTDQRRQDSYLFLRANYFQFGTSILDLGTYLVTTVLDTLDSLIVKFTIIAVAAISAVIMVAILSLPVTKLTNLYEEKILLVVSRVTYDQSQVEKLKLSVCQQLITLDSLDWLKYNYLDISSLRFNQFDVSVVNQQHDSIQKVKKSSGLQKVNADEALMNQTRTIYNTTTGADFSSKQLGKSSVMKPVKNLFQNLKSTSKSRNVLQQQNVSSTNRGGINKNYVLQSKIANQKLSVFFRFIPLFLITIGNTIYFLIIIIYLQQNKDLLKEPVYLNKNAIIYHIQQSNLKISAELLSFDSTFSSLVFPSSHLVSDLENYQSLMNTAIEQSQEAQLYTTNKLYGSNSLPTETVTIMKNLQEGQVCQYLVTFSCVQSTVGTQYGLNFLLQEKIRLKNTYPVIFSAQDGTVANLLSYSDSPDHKQIWLQSLLIEDEVQDLQSSTSNLSIGTTSNSVQTFFEQYLLIFGDIYAGIIIIVCFFSYRSLYRRIQLMNLFLTFIPEEKLQEEITLQMLKTLRRM